MWKTGWVNPRDARGSAVTPIFLILNLSANRCIFRPSAFKNGLFGRAFKNQIPPVNQGRSLMDPRVWRKSRVRGRSPGIVHLKAF